jgi:pyruvate/2-oxoglutarate dehydrogenase complex dihydrolipoamide dehydrogenase (E3) component
MSKETIKTDICIIGAGSGGLSVAAGAVQLGLSTVLIERAEMGGDCLNTGCVPSKALLAAAKQAALHRKKNIQGIEGNEPQIDFSKVKDHVIESIDVIAPNDSVERFEGLGVKVIKENSRFVGRDLIEAGNYLIKAKKIVIAAGSRAVIPAISGLDKERVFTNENIFSLRQLPDHLLVIGAGPVGVEMAQAHRRLGSEVSIFTNREILPRDDQKNVVVLRNVLLEEGIKIHEHVRVKQVKHLDTEVILTIEENGKSLDVSGSHLLIGAGRKPNLEGLGLENAGVEFDTKGVKVDARLRTSNKNIFAVGDIAGGPQFTHVAGYHAGIVIRNICFKIPAKVNYTALPWVTYSDPELAQTGLTEVSARDLHGDSIKVVESHLNENDRAIAERSTKGLIRVVTDKNGRILGASIVGANAGELISLWSLAISQKLKISSVAGLIVPYPTLSEVSKRAAGAWYTTKLFSDKTRNIVKLLQKIPF